MFDKGLLLKSRAGCYSEDVGGDSGGEVERESSFVGDVWEVNWPGSKLKFRNAGRCGGRGH
jgi:hypothetical protein